MRTIGINDPYRIAAKAKRIYECEERTVSSKKNWKIKLLAIVQINSKSERTVQILKFDWEVF